MPFLFCLVFCFCFFALSCRISEQGSGKRALNSTWHQSMPCCFFSGTLINYMLATLASLLTEHTVGFYTTYKTVAIDITQQSSVLAPSWEFVFILSWPYGLINIFHKYYAKLLISAVLFYSFNYSFFPTVRIFIHLFLFNLLYLSRVVVIQTCRR